MSSFSIWLSIKARESEKSSYETRKSQVSNVRNSISDVSDDYVININSNIDKLSEALIDGITGISNVHTLKNDILLKKEKVGTSDGHLSLYDDNLSSEIRECNTKINSLESEIRSLYRDYERALEEERRERERAREEAAKLVKKIFGK